MYSADIMSAVKVSPNDPHTPKRKSLCPHVADVSKKYLQETSLHGFKYVVEEKRLLGERIFWIVTLSFAVVVAIILIKQVWDKWQTTPVIVSFDSQVTPIWDIPFPAITICNMNKARQSKIRHVEEKLNETKGTAEHDKWTEEMMVINEICGRHGGHKKGTEEEEAENDSHTITAELVHDTLQDVAHPCSEMLISCYFEGHDYNCSELFHETTTDEGLCCSFNLFPPELMFKDGVEEAHSTFSEEDKERWSNWDPQNGFDHTPDETTSTGKTYLPHRPIGPGLHSGLSITMNVQEEEYTKGCVGFESVGFKTLLHTPISNPEMVEYGFAISPGTENFFTIAPDVIHADDRIHGIDPRVRNCFLKDEKHLAYYQHYTSLNCLMECASNYTFHKCGCVDYYMPRNRDMAFCSPKEIDCVEKSLTHVEETAYDQEHGVHSQCECLPGCTAMDFPHESSLSAIKRADLLKLPEEALKKNPKLKEDDYVTKNIAILHLYFKHLHFMKNERGQLFGPVDFLSNIGGLLGLCMGFSALSLFEMFYFFVMRLGLNVGMPREENL